MLSCNISKEREPWESKMQNSKSKMQKSIYVKCKMQKAAHRIGMLYCDISKERDPWESKMQNSKGKMQNAIYVKCKIQNAKSSMLYCDTRAKCKMQKAGKACYVVPLAKRGTPGTTAITTR